MILWFYFCQYGKYHLYNTHLNAGVSWWSRFSNLYHGEENSKLTVEKTHILSPGKENRLHKLHLYIFFWKFISISSDIWTLSSNPDRKLCIFISFYALTWIFWPQRFPPASGRELWCSERREGAGLGCTRQYHADLSEVLFLDIWQYVYCIVCQQK